jgi:outer membrane protein TolC
MRVKLIACLIPLLAAGPAAAEDLLSVYRDGLAQDAVYGSARASYQAAKEKIVQGRALLLPNLNLTANANCNSTDTEYDDTLPNVRVRSTTRATARGSTSPSRSTGARTTSPMTRRRSRSARRRPSSARRGRT